MYHQISSSDSSEEPPFTFRQLRDKSHFLRILRELIQDMRSRKISRWAVASFLAVIVFLGLILRPRYENKVFVVDPKAPLSFENINTYATLDVLAELHDPQTPYILQSNQTANPVLPYWSEEGNKALRSLVTAAYTITHHRPPWCSLTPWHLKRYESIINSDSKIFLALNLYQNEIVLNTFLQSLSTLLPMMGPHRFFISISENGSTDETPRLLRVLARMFDLYGVAYRIESEGETKQSDKSDGKRIYVLAAVRNKALEPFYQSQPGTYEPVLFMNDIYHCAADVLEMLYQHAEQGADMSCSLDWQDWMIYDRWVLRSMSGHTYYDYKNVSRYSFGLQEGLYPNDAPRLLPWKQDREERERIGLHLPTQVFSCWNGMAVMNSKAFYPPHNIRFREAKNDPEHEHTENASECFLLPVDLWKAGLYKIQVIPRAAVAYWRDWHDRVRKDWNVPSLWDQRTMASREKVKWKSDPPALVGYQDKGRWWKPERWASWDEA